MTVHVLDFNRIEIYEAGAVLITLLAYPGASEEPRREDVHASLCHVALRLQRELDPAWALSSQPIKPFYALRTPQEVNKDLRTVPRAEVFGIVEAIRDFFPPSGEWSHVIGGLYFGVFCGTVWGLAI